MHKVYECPMLNASWANILLKVIFQAPRSMFTSEFCFHAGSQFVKVRITIFK